MITTLEKFIEGSNYSVTQFPARRALRLKARLIKHFGPGVAQILIPSEETSASEQKQKFVKAIETLSLSLDENQMESLAIELLSCTRKNGVELTAPNIDLEFAGDMSALYQVIWFVIEANFANFFTLLGIGNQFSEANPANKADDTKRTFKRT
jgi:hypothetical protein